MERDLRARRHDRRTRRIQRVILVVPALLLVAAITFWIARTLTLGAGASRDTRAILALSIVDGWVPVAVYTLAAVCLLIVLLRKPTRRWVTTVLVAIIASAALGIGVMTAQRALVMFGVQFDLVVSLWVVGVFIACGVAVANMWASSVPRRAVAGVAVVTFIAAGAVGINADAGINSSLGGLIGAPVEQSLAFPALSAAEHIQLSSAGTEPLWKTWHAPASLPAHGVLAQAQIPAPHSHFSARAAGIYLPPAALVPNPPALPLVIMMMGQPGNPDPTPQAKALDAFAATHHGLAPIVIVADQLGNPLTDTLCVDSKQRGGAQTYLAADVVDWARSHLRVLQDPAHWVIAGYSNGGECAVELGATFPGTWGTVLDVSGEKKPGEDAEAQTLAAVFGGDENAYRAAWPSTALAAGTYPNSFGVFTAGAADPLYRPDALELVAAAKAAKWTTKYVEISAGDHLGRAFTDGLAAGYAQLYPRLGLSPTVPAAAQ